MAGESTKSTRNRPTLHVMQSGRSMVEMIAVLVIIAILGIGALALYKSAMNRQLADTLFNDFRVRAVLSTERNSFFSGGSGYQDLHDADPTSQSRLTHSTYGNDMIVNQDQPTEGYFTITAYDVQSGVCDRLLQLFQELFSEENTLTPKPEKIYLNKKPFGVAINKCPGEKVSFAAAYRSARADDSQQLVICEDNDQCCEDPANCSLVCDKPAGETYGSCRKPVKTCGDGTFLEGYECTSCGTISGTTGKSISAQQCYQCNYTYIATKRRCYGPCEDGQFRSDNGACVACNSLQDITTSTAECSRCPLRYALNGHCYSACGTGNFRTLDGKCVSCKTKDVVFADKAQCDRCTKREWDEDTSCTLTQICDDDQFLNTSGICIPCDDEVSSGRDLIIEDSEATCPNRVIIKEDDNNYYYVSCNLPGSFKPKDPTACQVFCQNRFIDNNGNCIPCNNNGNAPTSFGNCSRCDGRYFYAGTCYPPCGDTNQFHDIDGACKTCDISDNISTTQTECQRCDGRYFHGGTCYAQCETNQFHDTDGACRSCNASGDIPADQAECEKCENREWEEGICKGDSTDKCADVNCQECTECNPENGQCENVSDTTTCGNEHDYICQSGVCTDPCTIGEHTTSTCTPSYHAQNGECVPEYAIQGTPCGEGQTCDGQGTCSCPENMELEDDVCVCKRGYFEDATGNCISCLNGPDEVQVDATNGETQCNRCSNRFFSAEDNNTITSEKKRNMCYLCSHQGAIKTGDNKIDPLTSEQQCNICISYAQGQNTDLQKQRNLRSWRSATGECRRPCATQNDTAVVPMVHATYNSYKNLCRSFENDASLSTSQLECDIVGGDYSNGKCYGQPLHCEDNEFRDTTNIQCVPCTDDGEYTTIQSACLSCNKNGQQIRAFNSSTGKCVRSTCPMLNQFKTNSGECVSCDTTGGVGTTQEYCDECSNRFYANDGKCYPCSHSSDVTASSTQCNRCIDYSWTTFNNGNGNVDTAKSNIRIPHNGNCLATCNQNTTMELDNVVYDPPFIHGSYFGNVCRPLRKEDLSANEKECVIFGGTWGKVSGKWKCLKMQ